MAFRLKISLLLLATNIISEVKSPARYGSGSKIAPNIGQNHASIYGRRVKITTGMTRFVLS